MSGLQQNSLATPIQDDAFGFMPDKEIPSDFQISFDTAYEKENQTLPQTKSKILIIQGDWEAGMSLLSQDLQDAGHEVGKVIFCASDYIYKARGIQTHLFRNRLEQFASWLRDLVRREDYDTVFLYNHYRPYNQIVWDLSDELGLECWVFELGLIRPNCVMVFEKHQAPWIAVESQWSEMLSGERDFPQKVETPVELCRVSTPVKLFLFGSSFVFSRLTSPLFPNFVDQRDMNLWKHVKHGVIHLWRFFERASDEEYDSLFANELSGKYFTVPLQVHSDTQILKNSNFKSIEEFIATVVDSFSKHAPTDSKLVFKVHPMDRGYRDYEDLICGMDKRLGGGRLLYVDRVHLPTLLEHSKGVVNINSSVGISGLIRRTPVIALGNAVYNLPELTFQGDLDAFWTEAKRPEASHVQAFLNTLLQLNQGRGTLSQRCFNVPGRCRIKWPQPFYQRFFESD